MTFEGLDSGDESRRFGDYVALPHPDSSGTALDSVTIPQGVPVTYDGTDIAESTVVGDDIVGILANYRVYGTTGSQKVKDKANIKMRGEALADLSDFSPTVGSYLDDNADILVLEEVDSSNNIYRVQVR